MGIFSSNTHTMKASSSHQNLGRESNDKTSEVSDNNTHSSTHSSASSQRSACGCGSCHKAKPIEEDVVEVKEEWDY